MREEAICELNDIFKFKMGKCSEFSRWGEQNRINFLKLIEENLDNLTLQLIKDWKEKTVLKDENHCLSYVEDILLTLLQ